MRPILFSLILPLGNALPPQFLPPLDFTKVLKKPGRSASMSAGTLAWSLNDVDANIRADSNRDGKVDIRGGTDIPDKWKSTTTAGALFLANIGDTDGRCAKLHQDVGQLVTCHDADDDIQRAPQYMANIRTVPIANIGASASGTISVSDKTARSLVRIFRPQANGSWQIVKPDTTFSSQELKQGLNLGIDAREVRTPGRWDGRATVSFTVKDAEKTSTDSVVMRVAPLITHHHKQLLERVVASSSVFSIIHIEEFVRVRKLNVQVQRLGTASP